MNTDKAFCFNICLNLCSSVPLFLYFAFLPALSAADLAGRIDKLLADSPAAAAAFWGIEIRDLKPGEVVYSQNQNKFFVPASNTKLFTIALALNRLGPNYTFETRVVADRAPDQSGRIAGDLRLVGGGDPDLSARTIPYAPGPVTGNPLAAIEDLADQVVASWATIPVMFGSHTARTGPSAIRSSNTVRRFRRLP